MRLIDAEALVEKIKEKIDVFERDLLLDKGSWLSSIRLVWFKQLFIMVEAIPTIEAKPVVHAHWKEWYPPKEFILTGEERLYICSNCDAKYSNVENNRFCPWCGAQMDESISCSHEDDNHIAEDGKKGVKIPVISMEDVPKIMEELPSVEENPILKAVKEMENNA